MAKQPRNHDPNTAERSVYFYRLNVGTTAAGEHKAFPVVQVLEHLSGLEYVDRLVEPDRPDMPTALAIVDRAAASGRMRLAHVRREGLPQIEEAGRLRDLEIPEHAGLVEVVHLKFFPHNILGALFNFFGPRPTRLAHYLMNTADGICPRPFRVEPLLRQDAAERLADMRELRVLNLRVQRTYADELQAALGANTVGAALRGMLEVGGVEDAQLVIRASRKRDGHLPNQILAGLRRLARRPDLREGVSQFKVKGRNADGLLEQLDILRDDFLLKKRVPLAHQRGRALDTEAAYDAIVSAHRELGDALRRAASITPADDEE